MKYKGEITGNYFLQPTIHMSKASCNTNSACLAK